MSDNTLSIAASVGNLSPADILAENNVKLLVAYAISSKADPDILAILAAHDSVAVREAVAEKCQDFPGGIVPSCRNRTFSR